MNTIRNIDHEAVLNYRAIQKCSLQEAVSWDDKRRYTEAINAASTIEDLKQTLRVIIQRVF